MPQPNIEETTKFVSPLDSQTSATASDVKEVEALKQELPIFRSDPKVFAIA